jgi:hypothetical protein
MLVEFDVDRRIEFAVVTMEPLSSTHFACYSQDLQGGTKQESQRWKLTMENFELFDSL